jgi:F-type H+-transporting ATPase subunit epsilon
MPARTFRIKLLSPDRVALDADAVQAVLPAFDGEWGVLAGHAPLVAALGTGCLRVSFPDGTGRGYAVRGGFAQVRNNVLTVLAAECRGAGELDAAAVDAELAKSRGDETKARQAAWARACRLALHGRPPRDEF